MPKTIDGTTEIVWARVDAVVNLILENDRYFQSKRGKELTDIVMQRFGVSDRTAQRYVVEAKKEIRRIGGKDARAAFIKAIQDREFLFQAAKGRKDEKGKWIESPDFRLALEVVKDRDKLFGLYVDKVDFTGEVKMPDLSGLSLKELHDLLKGLKELAVKGQ